MRGLPVLVLLGACAAPPDYEEPFALRDAVLDRWMYVDPARSEGADDLDRRFGRTCVRFGTDGLFSLWSEKWLVPDLVWEEVRSDELWIEGVGTVAFDPLDDAAEELDLTFSSTGRYRAFDGAVLRVEDC